MECDENKQKHFLFIKRAINIILCLSHKQNYKLPSNRKTIVQNLDILYMFSYFYWSDISQYFMAEAEKTNLQTCKT